MSGLSLAEDPGEGRSPSPHRLLSRGREHGSEWPQSGTTNGTGNGGGVAHHVDGRTAHWPTATRCVPWIG